VIETTHRCSLVCRCNARNGLAERYPDCLKIGCIPSQPMRLARVPEPFDSPDFIYELKYDGFRALAYVTAGEVKLVSRRGIVYKSFTSVCDEIRAVVGRHAAVIDGEIVYLDSEGRPQFYDLLRRRGDAHFVAFDLLELDGCDLTGLPLVKRKRRLRALLPESGPVLYASHIDGRGIELYTEVCRRDLEGIVAKWKHGRYVNGSVLKSSWIKVKNPAYSQMAGRSELFRKRH
jgi:bifunctional non-homologous end joining protein LigD